MSDDDITRLTVRLQTHTMERLREELSHLNNEAARIRFLAQFYLDYKEMRGQPMPAGKTSNDTSDEEFDTQE